MSPTLEAVSSLGALIKGDTPKSYRISGDLTNTDNVMNNTFWIGVQPALTREMLEFAVQKIETYLGVNF